MTCFLFTHSGSALSMFCILSTRSLLSQQLNYVPPDRMLSSICSLKLVILSVLTVRKSILA